jgi:hypothetical protein
MPKARLTDTQVATNLVDTLREFPFTAALDEVEQATRADGLSADILALINGPLFGNLFDALQLWIERTSAQNMDDPTERESNVSPLLTTTIVD